jgi:hypothetical protein
MTSNKRQFGWLEPLKCFLTEEIFFKKLLLPFSGAVVADKLSPTFLTAV